MDTSSKTEKARNFLKAMLFEAPQWIPCSLSVLPATWFKYAERLDELLLEHPRIFPEHRRGSFLKLKLQRNYQKGRWKDVWGVVWENCVEGMSSIPVESKAPLRDWETLEDYEPPDPTRQDDLFGEPVEWEERRRALQRAKSAGEIATGWLSHGFMFMRLFYLRGFSNFMMDIALKDPRLKHLTCMVRDYNLRLVDLWVEAGAEMISAGDDLGMQTSLPMSPMDWRSYIKPPYKKIVRKARQNGLYFYLHSDGHIVEIIPDLIECGVNVINPQIRANGLENLARVAKGRVCINLDLDRQLFPFASPEEVREHILRCLDALYLPEGGLMLTAECAPDVPLENIRAIIETFEEIGGGPR